MFVPLEVGPAVCPRCGFIVTLTDPETGQATQHWELFSDALTEWHNGGPGIVCCPNSSSPVAINEWQWQDDWRVAVGHLGFEYWNWPIFHPDFVARISNRLGHRVVVTRGKL